MSKLNLRNKANQNIPVSNVFIEKYMAKANGSFVKVYLYGLLHSLQPGSNITNKDIADALDMIESDVHNAWKYWEKLGLIKINGDSDIEFLDLKDTIKNPSLLSAQTKPTYLPKELSIYIDNNSEISHLYKESEKMLGKQLSSNDASTLFSFYDWLRLPVAVIILMLEYCVSNDKRSLRYIEKVAIDWADRGIDDVNKAKIYLKELELRNSNISLIKSSFGLANKELAPVQKKYIDKWINEYKMDIRLIILACEQTIIKTNNSSFEYADKILFDWLQNNIKTVEAAISYSEEFKQKIHEKYSKTNKNKSSKDKFNNFTQRDSDYNEIVRLISEKKKNESRSS